MGRRRAWSRSASTMVQFGVACRSCPRTSVASHSRSPQGSGTASAAASPSLPTLRTARRSSSHKMLSVLTVSSDPGLLAATITWTPQATQLDSRHVHCRGAATLGWTKDLYTVAPSWTCVVLRSRPLPAAAAIQPAIVQAGARRKPDNLAHLHGSTSSFMS